MPYEPLVPSGYFETRRYLEDRALDRETAQTENAYKLALIEQGMREAEQARLTAPYEAEKARMGLLKSAEDLRASQFDNETKERQYLIQRMGPLVSAYQQGKITEGHFKALAQREVASAPFELSDEQRQALLRFGPQEWGLSLRQALTIEQQRAAPPAPQSFYQGETVEQRQWNPDTQSYDVVGGGNRFAPPKPRVQFITNDRGQVTAVGKAGPDGSWTVEELPGYGGQSDGAADEGLVEVPPGNIEEITGHLGPWPTAKEFLSRRVLPFAGVNATDEERDRARTRMRLIRSNLADANRIEGGRSNAFLNLALEAIPEQALENPKRAANALNEMLDRLRQAYEFDMRIYNNRSISKKIADASLERALLVKSVFEQLAAPLEGGASGAIERSGPSIFDDADAILRGE